MTKDLGEKIITVLDSVKDIDSVVARYKAKGWEPTSYSVLKTPPRSVRIKLRRATGSKPKQK